MSHHICTVDTVGDDCVSKFPKWRQLVLANAVSCRYTAANTLKPPEKVPKINVFIQLGFQ